MRSLVEEIREQVTRRGSAPAGKRDRSDENIRHLRSACDHVVRARRFVGQMPPQPRTLRARMGAVAVRLVQRLLFWYTPQIHHFHDLVAQAIDSTCSTAEGQRVELMRATERIAALEQQNASSRSGAATSNGTARRPTSSGAIEPADVRQAAKAEPEIPEAYLFALQNRFRGSEEETLRKLTPYIRFLRESYPALCKRPFLDLGCGRGEWLCAARGEGFEALGVDESQAAVKHCRRLDLNVQEGEALSFLRQAQPHSYSVVTAFHVIEHWAFGYLLAVLDEVQRVLEPGGLVILETPDPRNLNMASHGFWLDPTHTRPVPPKLLRETVSYFGMTPISVEGRNPAQNSELGAYAQLPFLEALDQRLAGPQDYSLIAVRNPLDSQPTQ